MKFRSSKMLALAIILSIATPTTAYAKSEKTTQTMTYDVYAGGIHALNAKLAITSDDKEYEITLSSKTRGFLKTLAPWAGVFSTTGIFDKDKHPFPKKHASISTWKSSTEEKKYTYDGQGNFKSYSVSETKKDKDPVDKTPKDLDPEISKGTTDVLSATYQLLLALPQTKSCTGDSLIFDGDRSFKLVFKETNTEALKESRYNIFNGESIYCQVEVVPDKGKWRKKPRGWLSIQEQGRKIGSLPTLWLGRMNENAPYVPVKIRVKTDYGTLFMHLTSYSQTN
ncbi:MAG TPA: DUF3108 domain-containing protein [Alphaproteobacteria bacterium]|nr:DUF3108 domain-containing protein [Alphaproteobacteria bacterium]